MSNWQCPLSPTHTKKALQLLVKGRKVGGAGLGRPLGKVSLAFLTTPSSSYMLPLLYLARQGILVRAKVYGLCYAGGETLAGGHPAACMP